MSKEAMKLALEALINHHGNYVLSKKESEQPEAAIKVLEEALAKQEPRNVTKDEHDILMKALAKSGKIVDAGSLAKQEQHTLSSRVNDVRVHIEHGKQHDEAMKRITAKQEQGEPVACERCKQLEEQAYDLLGQLKVANIKLAYTTPQPKQEQGEIERLTAALKKANEQAEHFEREWYLRDDELEKLKQEQSEPVAWINSKRDMTYIHGPYNADDIPLYTTPQQRKPLTEEQLIDLWPSLIMHQHTYAFARAIEAAHGIKE